MIIYFGVHLVVSFTDNAFVCPVTSTDASKGVITQRVSLALGPDVVQNCEALTCHAILLLVWLTPFLASHRRKLLMAALVLGRFALSEVGKSDWHLQ